MTVILFLVLFAVILALTLVMFFINYLKSNKEYDKNKVLMHARIVDYEIPRDFVTHRGGIDDDRVLSQMHYFKGISKYAANYAKVEIIETGEQVWCSFGHLVNEERYPKDKIFEVYYYKNGDETEVRSFDYPELFKKKRHIK